MTSLERITFSSGKNKSNEDNMDKAKNKKSTKKMKRKVDNYLRSLYDELETVHYKLEDNPTSVNLINRRLVVLKKIKWYLRYGNKYK